MRALVLPMSGDARVVRLPQRPELEQLRVIYDLIGCRYVQILRLTADLTMWSDEEATTRPVPPEPNRPAMLIGVAFGHAERYVGTVVYTGLDRRGDTTGLSDAQLATLAGLLDRIGVRIADELQTARDA